MPVNEQFIDQVLKSFDHVDDDFKFSTGITDHIYNEDGEDLYRFMIQDGGYEGFNNADRENRRQYIDAEVLNEIVTGGVHNYLNYAIHQKKINAVRELLSYGINVQTDSEQSFSPITVAAAFGTVEIFQYLEGFVDGHEPVIAIDQDWLKRLFLIAVAANNVEVVNYIKNKFAANVQLASIVDSEGNNALHLAAKYSSSEVMARLIEMGLNSSVSNMGNGNTPLHYAVMSGDASTVRQLCDAISDFNIANAEGRTPLDLAAIQADEEVLIRLMRDVSNVDEVQLVNLFKLCLEKQNPIVIELFYEKILAYEDKERILGEVLESAIIAGYAGSTKMIIENMLRNNIQVDWQALLNIARENEKVDIEGMIVAKKNRFNLLYVKVNEFANDLAENLVKKLKNEKRTKNPLINLFSHDYRNRVNYLAEIIQTRLSETFRSKLLEIYRSNEQDVSLVASQLAEKLDLSSFWEKLRSDAEHGRRTHQLDIRDAMVDGISKVYDDIHGSNMDEAEDNDGEAIQKQLNYRGASEKETWFINEFCDKFEESLMMFILLYQKQVGLSEDSDFKRSLTAINAAGAAAGSLFSFKVAGVSLDAGQVLFGATTFANFVYEHYKYREAEIITNLFRLYGVIQRARLFERSAKEIFSTFREPLERIADQEGIKEAADYAVHYVVNYMLEKPGHTEINPSFLQSLKELIFTKRGAATMESQSIPLEQVMLSGVIYGKKTCNNREQEVRTVSQERGYTIEGIFTRPGIRTLDRKQYGSNETNTSKYGYRLGTEEEAKKLGYWELKL